MTLFEGAFWPCWSLILPFFSDFSPPLNYLPEPDGIGGDDRSSGGGIVSGLVIVSGGVISSGDVIVRDDRPIGGVIVSDDRRSGV